MGKVHSYIALPIICKAVEETIAIICHRHDSAKYSYVTRQTC